MRYVWCPESVVFSGEFQLFINGLKIHFFCIWPRGRIFSSTADSGGLRDILGVISMFKGVYLIGVRRYFFIEQVLKNGDKLSLNEIGFNHLA